MRCTTAVSSAYTTPMPAPCALADIVFCGNRCIDTTTQCCQLNYQLGFKCPGTQVCVSDGAACATTCPGEPNVPGRAGQRAVHLHTQQLNAIKHTSCVYANNKQDCIYACW